MSTKQLSRRAFLKLAAASGSGVALAGLGPLSSVASAQDMVELTFGRHWEAAFRPRQAEYDEGFMERHPEISINITYNTWGDHNNVVPAWAAAGTLPDIIYVHGSRVAPWAHEGIIIDIHDLVTPDEEFNVEGIWEEAAKLYRVAGRYHAIPYDHGPTILGYNKDMFDAAGMDYPTPEWTMDDLRAAANELSNPDEFQWGWSGELSLTSAGPEFFLGAWNAATINETETEMTLGTPEGHEALNFWYDMTHVDNVSPTAAESESFPNANPWLQGRCAMAVVPTWETPTLRAQASFEWDVAPTPMGADGTRKTGAFGSGYGITPTSAQPDVAWTYLREYLSLDGMIFMWSLSGRGSPARPEGLEVWESSDPAPPNAHYYREAMFDYAVTSRPYESLVANEVSDIMNTQTLLLRLGEISVEDAIAVIMEEAQASLDSVADDM